MVERRVFEPRPGALRRWRKALTDWKLHKEGEAQAQECVHDSADERLRAAGLELVTLGRAPALRCELRALGRDELVVSSAETLEAPPRFAWELPSAVAGRVAPTLESRLLHPVARREVRSLRWSLRNADDKVVARLEDRRERRSEAQEHAEQDPAAEAARGAARHRLVLSGLRGYGLEFERIAGALLESGVVTPAAEESAPTGRGARRRAASTTLDAPLRLDPRLPAREAIEVLSRPARGLFAAELPGLCAGSDPECLHQVRVAVRRLRTLLADLRGVLAPELEAELASDLRWLAERTGPARDLDVLLLSVRLQERARRAALTPLTIALEAERAELQVALELDLDSARWRALAARLGDGSRPLAKPDSLGAHADAPVAARLARALRRRLRQVEAGLRVPDADAVLLHGTRITCKKLRVLLDVVRSVLPDEARTADCERAIKKLQSALGGIQDAAVQQRALQSWNERTHEPLEEGARIALSELLADTARAERRARKSYASAREAWSSGRAPRRLKHLRRALEAAAASTP